MEMRVVTRYKMDGTAFEILELDDGNGTDRTVTGRQVTRRPVAESLASRWRRRRTVVGDAVKRFDRTTFTKKSSVAVWTESDDESESDEYCKILSEDGVECHYPNGVQQHGQPETHETMTMKSNYELLNEIRSKAMNQPGYVSGETLVNHYDNLSITVISTWQSVEDWIHWEESDDRASTEAELESLLEEPTRFEVYDLGRTPK